MKTVLIAGGTGFLGKHLEKHLMEKGYDVKILTRNPNRDNHVGWIPEQRTIDATKCEAVQVLINLCGEGITNKRWTSKQKQLLIDSRIETTKTLFELKSSFPNLEHYVSASGVNAYGFDDGMTEHVEEKSYGKDFISKLVEKWENAADLFASDVIVSKLRVAIVLEKGSGALEKMSQPIRMGFGSPLGTGKQQIPWVHISDLSRIVEFVIQNKLSGTFNTNAGNISNEELTKAIAVSLNKRIWLSKVPPFALKLLLGQMSEVILNGTKASNERLKKHGFVFLINSIDKALN